MEAEGETSMTGSPRTSSMLAFLRRHEGCITGVESLLSLAHFDAMSGLTWDTLDGSPIFILSWSLPPASSPSPPQLILLCHSCGASLVLTLDPKPSPGKP